jgi:prepilin-type N-terminal cleavage/methylation domain-containing protein
MILTSVDAPCPAPVGAIRDRHGFSLIELLTVIAVIGILAAILVPVIGGIRERARVTAATSDAKQIANAWRLYYNDRGEWPDPQAFEPEGSEAKSSERDDGEVFWNAYVRLLTGDFDSSESSFADNNPGATAYLSLTPDQIDENGEFVDPWENPYKFKLDKRYREGSDGELVDGTKRGDLKIGRFSYAGYGSPDNPSDEQIVVEDLAIAWSRGPDENDHNPEVAEDDPKSW